MTRNQWGTGGRALLCGRIGRAACTEPEGRTDVMCQPAHSDRCGTMDTSPVSTDDIDDPRTMNSVYDFVARRGLARLVDLERLAGGEPDDRQVSDVVAGGPLLDFCTVLLP
jgi:hypothetical protein